MSVVIDKVKLEDIGGDTKPIVMFRGKDRGLVLNKTNASMIAEIAGSDETNDWAGVGIVLYPTKTDYQGKRVDAIRVDYPANHQPKPAPVAQTGNADEDDPIPF